MRARVLAGASRRFGASSACVESTLLLSELSRFATTQDFGCVICASIAFNMITVRASLVTMEFGIHFALAIAALPPAVR